MFLSTDSAYSTICLLLILSTNVEPLYSLKCSRIPEGHGALQTPADGRFHIRILENTNKYTPGKTYTIKLVGIDAGRSVRHKFSGFMLAVEKKSNDSGISEMSIKDINDFNGWGLRSIGDHEEMGGVYVAITKICGVKEGIIRRLPLEKFTLSHGDTFTKITCANMVTHTTTTPKSEIQVLWTAPQPESGCVVFKATVIEHRDVWYMDDGPLSKEFCEDEQSFDDTLSAPLTQCRACAEAKYELTFEGLWSRNTHPKDFPSNNWVTRFGDIIGTSHTIDYRFWQYGNVAKDGLQQMAEHGATRGLEAELKSQSGQIRTIIKAKGLAYPNVTGKTFAVFRVDPNHHLVSFVSMIDPSPDWFLGVSGLELCLENGTWAESKILDLYPWDAGTDSGPSYTSPDQPTNPRDHIRRIRSDFPNDPRSPFYDPSGANMKPLARLFLSRQRLYEINCPDIVDNESESDPRNPCALGPWQESSPCDAECGQGKKLQQREYLREHAASRAQCNSQLTQRIDCYGRGPNCNEQSDEVEETTESSCALTDWSEWSECLPRCGHGKRTRTRKYVQKKAKKRCEGGTNFPLLKQSEECHEPCSGDPSDIPNPNDRGEGQEAEEEEETPCELTNWSQFSPCSVSCGGGVKIRTRTPIVGKCDNEVMEDSKSCNKAKCEIPDFCEEDPQTGNCRNTTNLWFYNRNDTRCDVFTWSCGEHGNKFATSEECLETCTGRTLQFQNDRKGNRGRNRNRNYD